MASGVLSVPLMVEYQAVIAESGYSMQMGFGEIYFPVKNHPEDRLSYMRLFGKFQKTGTQTVTSGTLIGHLTTAPKYGENYAFPLVAYDTSTGYIHSGLVFNTQYGQLLVRTNDSAFLTAINNGHVFHLSTTF